jgi:alginate O-acetyltransferase complex protein AlgI
VLFTQLSFFAFLAVLTGIYWGLSSNRNRKLLLLFASYAFYSAWDWRFLSLILLSTVVDYFVGLRLEATDSKQRRKLLLLLSLAVNLGMLGFFKYFNFFADGLQQLLSLVGLEADWNTLNIILPVGISFYTFQTLSYTIDVYRKELAAEKNFSNFALFVAFFPQLVAGPIVRAKDFLYQLSDSKRFSEIDFRWVGTLFMIGFIKKAVIADNLAIFVDAFYANPASFSSFDAWVAVCAYAAQIYCDFSGYTDMAIAVAGLLGYRLHPNFATPYVATDISDFWRRWHISLSTWLRDYLYIPLGGSRHGELNTYRNLMLTMLLGGLWHGASLNFVFWGGMHGLGLSIQRIWANSPRKVTLPTWLASMLTLIFVILLWVPFRAANFDTSWQVLLLLFSFTPAQAAGETQAVALACGLIFMLVLHHCRNKKIFFSFWRNAPTWVYAISFGSVFALSLALRALDYQPFIYFQF